MQDQALILLIIILAVMFVEVSALLSILLACSRGKRKNQPQMSIFTSTQTLSPFESDHDFSKAFPFELRKAFSPQPNTFSEMNYFDNSANSYIFYCCMFQVYYIPVLIDLSESQVSVSRIECTRSERPSARNHEDGWRAAKDRQQI